MTPENAARIIRKINPFVDIEGEEKDRMMVVLALLEPTYSTNNQYTLSFHYEHAGVEYVITYLPDRPPSLSYRAYDDHGDLLHPTVRL